MSPSEDDLRAALHQGEGAPPDVNRIVAAGMAKRAQRRNLVTAALAGVLVAGGVTIGAVAFTGGDDQRTDAGRPPAAADTGQPNNRARPSSSNGAQAPAPPVEQNPNGGASAGCPARFPRPFGTATGPGAPLFADGLRSVTVCAYGSDLDIAHNAAPTSVTLVEQDAARLAASLETAPKSRSGRTCLPTRTQNLVLLPVTSSGERLDPVTVTFSEPRCDGRITNGTALRYGWTPPDQLQSRLQGLTPRATTSLPSHSPSGKNHGSPVR